MSHHFVQLEELIWFGGPSRLPHILNEVEQAHKHNTSTTVIGNLLWESYYPITADFVAFFEELDRKNIPIVVVTNDNVKNSDIVNKMIDLGVRLIYVDFFRWRVYQEVIVKQKNKTNLFWNKETNKFLFLTGKPDKPNRVELLWKLYEKNLLNHATWSFYVHNDSRNQVIDELVTLGIDRNQATQFIDEYQCIPDNADIIFCNGGSTHYGGIPYAESLYSDVKFRIVSETKFEYSSPKNPWITEKTWLTIVNRCPFIMAGELGILEKLKSLGFCTFTEYLEIPEYYTIQDHQERLDAIVTNTDSWLKNSDSLDNIQKDVEYNYNRFIQSCKEMEQSLLNQVQQYGLHLQVANLVPTDDNIAENLIKN